VTEAALLADLLVTSYDANVQVHLPTQTLATSLEARALELTLELLNLPKDVFRGRTLTTGATAANVCGLACARDALFLKGTKTVPAGWVVAEDGFPPGGAQVEILGARVHASVHFPSSNRRPWRCRALADWPEPIWDSPQLVKAAAVTGIGRRNVVDLGAGDLSFDLARLEDRLQQNRELGKASIVAVGFGEINTCGRDQLYLEWATWFWLRQLRPGCSGGFTPDVLRLRELCDKYGAWMHIVRHPRSSAEAAVIAYLLAFGAFAAALPELAHYVKDLTLADSIVVRPSLPAWDWKLEVQALTSISTSVHAGRRAQMVRLASSRDCSLRHAWADTFAHCIHRLNLPYDCGLLFTRSADSLPRSFGPSPASAPPPYLTPGASVTTQPPVPSPLNVGIENSRRFRALPLYASLLSLGRQGYRAIIERNVAVADRIRAWMASPEGIRFYTVLNPPALSTTDSLPLNIVLFRGSADLAPACPWHPDRSGAGSALTEAINDGRQIYVSPTIAWDGRGACRIAVSNWAAGTGGEAEWERVREALIAVGELGLRGPA
jgi:glutamate/tyrosine decarboxylase-like PLP-dependent enzyme